MPLREPWNDWFHCSGHTYGSWLRGDPRGWRARNHREHVEGDYRNPPRKGSFERLHDRSKELMRREAVLLAPQVQEIVCVEMVESLKRHDIEVVAAAVTARHFHILARIPGRRARHFIGIAKKDAARKVSDLKVVQPGGLWAKRSKADPIRDRAHQINTVWYILDHVDERGAIWAPEKILTAHEERRKSKKR